MKTKSPIFPAAVGLALIAGPLLSQRPASAQDTPPAPAASRDASAFLPEAFSPDEHASTWANPPFSREVLPEVTDTAQPDVPGEWEGWQIAAVDRFGGKFTVGLVSKKNEFFLLKEGESHDKTSVMITKVESNGVIADTVVHVTDGNRSGTLTFETKRLSQASKGLPQPKAAPVRGGQRAPSRQPATPQQQARQTAAKQQAQAELSQHLNTAVTPGAQGGAAAQPAAAQPQPAAAQGGGSSRRSPSSSQTRRRTVVLPPSTKR